MSFRGFEVKYGVTDTKISIIRKITLEPQIPRQGIILFQKSTVKCNKEKQQETILRSWNGMRHIINR